MKSCKTKLVASAFGVCCLASLPTLAFAQSPEYAQPPVYGTYSYYQPGGLGSDGANLGISSLYDQAGVPNSGPIYDQAYGRPIYDQVGRQRYWAGSYPNPVADGSSAIAFEAGFPFNLGRGYPGHFAIEYYGGE
jgi:hypothetical protein